VKFEIVNHSHNYPRLLAWQLSSLILYPPKGHEVTYTLYSDPDDEATRNTVDFFVPKLPAEVRLAQQSQKLPYLRNRAVGRNEAARATTADWVWFTDTDYLFLNKCWDDLATRVAAKPALRFVWPALILETDWPTGDRMIAQMDKLAVRNVLLTGIPGKRMPRAIGGIQIAHGPTVREIGYCPEITGPRDEWLFRSDVQFRHHPALNPRDDVALGYALRIRHSKRGYGMPERHSVRN
jgi:hypothetical protein